MAEISELFDSAFAKSSANFQRQAAMRMVARTDPDTPLGELLGSDAGIALRSLALRDLADALQQMRLAQGWKTSANSGKGIGGLLGGDSVAVDADARRLDDTALNGNGAVSTAPDASTSASDEERAYRAILVALEEGGKTIGQLSKAVEIDTDQLRGYLRWMQDMGKIARNGRARATRYHLSG